MIARRTAARIGLLALLTVVSGWLLPGRAAAQVAMPDPSQIHGKAIPAPELPNGTVTVRVVRESVGNNLPGQEVTVTAGGTTRTSKSDDQGRAQFTDLPQGAQATAVATVDGERLTSDPFAVPAQGGLRVILVAGIAQAAERKKAEEAKALAEPAVKGIVVLGSNTRVLMEFQDDALQVFYLLEILNNARTRVDIGGPLVLDLPTGAAGAATLEGSSQQANINGDRVVIAGPFAPGATSVQIGYTLKYPGSSYEFRQKWPVALEQVTFALEQTGPVTMTSPQFGQTQSVRSENGSMFLLANGPALPAGGTLTVNLAGLPAESVAPKYIALALAGTILIAGVVFAVRRPVSERDVRGRLIARRDTLLGDLAQLEARRLQGQDTPANAARRQKILAELEQIYGELDEAGATPPGGGEGMAA